MPIAEKERTIGLLAATRTDANEADRQQRFVLQCKLRGCQGIGQGLSPRPEKRRRPSIQGIDPFQRIDPLMQPHVAPA